MESNLLNEQTAKMKTEQFQPIKKLVKSNSFKEDSINSDMSNPVARTTKHSFNECPS